MRVYKLFDFNEKRGGKREKKLEKQIVRLFTGDGNDASVL